MRCSSLNNFYPEVTIRNILSHFEDTSRYTSWYTQTQNNYFSLSYLLDVSQLLLFRKSSFFRREHRAIATKSWRGFPVITDNFMYHRVSFTLCRNEVDFSVRVLESTRFQYLSSKPEYYSGRFSELVLGTKILTLDSRALELKLLFSRFLDFPVPRLFCTIIIVSGVDFALVFETSGVWRKYTLELVIEIGRRIANKVINYMMFWRSN